MSSTWGAWACRHTDVGWQGSLSVDSLGSGWGGSWVGQFKGVSVTSDFDPRTDHPHGANIQRLSSELSLPDTQPRAPRPWPLSLLVPGRPLPESLLPRDPAPEDDSSNLTHGNSPPLAQS